MSYFTKEEYEAKKRYADRISSEALSMIASNLELIEPSSIEALEELSCLSHLRHTVHCEGYNIGNELSRANDLVELIAKVKEICKEYNVLEDLSDLITPRFDEIPTLDDDEDLIVEYAGWNPNDYIINGEWNHDAIVEDLRYLLNDINNYWSDSIRHFFKKINKKYGTDYPSGGEPENQSVKRFFNGK